MTIQRLATRRQFRSSKRASRRGAVYVEAMMVVPIFVLVWIAMLFITNLYAGTLRAGSEARTAAWSAAMSNCTNPGNGGELAQTPGFDTSFADSMIGNETFGLSTFGREVVGSAESPEFQYLGQTFQTEQSIRLPCNIAPIDGNSGIELARFAMGSMASRMRELVSATAADILVRQTAALAAYMAVLPGQGPIAAQLAAMEASHDIQMIELQAVPTDADKGSIDGLTDLQSGLTNIKDSASIATP